jgi:hypothetical protein
VVLLAIIVAVNGHFLDERTKAFTISTSTKVLCFLFVLMSCACDDPTPHMHTHCLIVCDVKLA